MFELGRCTHSEGLSCKVTENIAFNYSFVSASDGFHIDNFWEGYRLFL